MDQMQLRVGELSVDSVFTGGVKMKLQKRSG